MMNQYKTYLFILLWIIVLLAIVYFSKNIITSVENFVEGEQTMPSELNNVVVEEVPQNNIVVEEVPQNNIVVEEVPQNNVVVEEVPQNNVVVEEEEDGFVEMNTLTTLAPSSYLGETEKVADNSVFVPTIPPVEEQITKLVQFDLKYLLTQVQTLNDLSETKKQEILQLTKQEAENLGMHIYNKPYITEDVLLVIEVSNSISENDISKLDNILSKTFSEFVCPSEVKCPLASVLSSYPEIGEQWGNSTSECVKVISGENGTCARCPPGTYVDYANVTGVCTPCPAGQYSDSYNSLECKACAGAPAGSKNCNKQESVQMNENTCNQAQSGISGINVFDPTITNAEILSKIYNGNMQKFKQSEALKFRIKQLEQKMSNYADVETAAYRSSL
jgi:hypothetical protein